MFCRLLTTFAEGCRLCPCVLFWSLLFVCVCADRGERFPRDMSSCSGVSHAALQDECLLGLIGIGRLDGWLKKGHAHHINSPSLCHLRCSVALQRWSRVVLIQGAVASPPFCCAVLNSPLFPRLFRRVIKVQSVSDGWAHSGPEAA